MTIGRFGTPNDHPDPHYPDVEWYLHSSGRLAAYYNQLRVDPPPPATPEREALWIAIRLLGRV